MRPNRSYLAMVFVTALAWGCSDGGGAVDAGAGDVQVLSESTIQAVTPPGSLTDLLGGDAWVFSSGQLEARQLAGYQSYVGVLE